MKDKLRAKTGVRLPIILGFGCIIGAGAGFGSWAFTAPLASAVVAQGVVAVDTKRKKIQHLDGGIVKELLVRDGDVVKAGAVIVRLDATKAEANYEIVRGSYLTASAQEARLPRGARRESVDCVPKGPHPRSE